MFYSKINNRTCFFKSALKNIVKDLNETHFEFLTAKLQKKRKKTKKKEDKLLTYIVNNQSINLSLSMLYNTQTLLCFIQHT